MESELLQAQLNAITYVDAISYYKGQKQKFISEYAEAVGISVEQAKKQYINKFFQTINTSNLQKKSFSKSFELTGKLNTILVEALKTEDMSQFEKFKNENFKKYKDLSERGKKELQSSLFNLISIDQVYREIESALPTLGQDQELISKESFLSWTKSYLSASLLNKIQNIEKTKGNLPVLAGFFEEALVHQATGQLTEHLKEKTKGAMLVGSKKISNTSGKNKVESIFDEYFNFFSSDLDKDFYASIIVDDNTLASGFGAQVKLWNPPWMLKTPVNRRKISSNATLYGQWREKTNWLSGVKFLERHAKQAIGDNVMYITGNTVMWTYKLIQQFREHNYFLAFLKENREFSKNIGWELPSKKLI